MAKQPWHTVQPDRGHVSLRTWFMSFTDTPIPSPPPNIRLPTAAGNLFKPTPSCTTDIMSPAGSASCARPAARRPAQVWGGRRWFWGLSDTEAGRPVPEASTSHVLLVAASPRVLES